MRFLWYFRLSTYLLIASGFLALSVTDDYGLFAVMLFVLILVVGWQVDAGKLTLRFSQWWWNLATIVVLLLCLADALFLRQVRSVALVNFLIFLQATKVFTPKQHRDYITIYIISFFELLVSSILTLNIWFAVSCLCFIISATWALITLHLKKDIETYILPRTAPTDSAAQNEQTRFLAEQAAFNTPTLNALLNFRFFTSTFGITLLTCGMALIVFAILPRLREGVLLGYGTDLSQRISGFAEVVTLDGFGAIRLNHSPVMRVTLPAISDPAQLPNRLYWKGIAYNMYDGKRWRADTRRRKQFSVQAQEPNLYWFNWQANTDNLLAQQIELASPRLEVIFGASSVAAVEGRFLSLQYDKTTGNTHVVLLPSALKYTVYSQTTPPTADALQHEQGNYPETIKALYLQVPPLADRVTALAHQIGDKYANAYDQARAIQNFLLQNYTYSLSVQRNPDLLPLEDFLFVNKAGHCEYYATSMAILLRILGIPTRVVNGFAQGRWNEFGQFFTVRQSDAHAWVEVFFPAAGWVTFDPTPAVAFAETYQQFAEQENFAASVYRYYEYLRVRWNRYIVDYSRDDQAQTIVSTFIAMRSARHNFRDAWEHLKQRLENAIPQLSWREIGGLLALVSSGLMLIYGLVRLLRRFHIRLPVFRPRRRSAGKPHILFYQTMLRTLAKKGIAKRAAMTPGEFARHVAQHHALYGEDVRYLTEAYHAVRYGCTELPPEILAQIENRLRTLKKKPKMRQE